MIAFLKKYGPASDASRERGERTQGKRAHAREASARKGSERTQGKRAHAREASARKGSERQEECCCPQESVFGLRAPLTLPLLASLARYFAPDTYEPEYNLAIVSGEDGARLSHSHERQYYFALQSLTLWRDILDDMFRLWSLAEEDLVSESIGYTLKDTGQGFQRVQQSPRTYKAMQQILQRVQANVDTWIGSSVVHLGDHNVPNALNFIDK
jgi:hypothetical protein